MGSFVRKVKRRADAPKQRSGGNRSPLSLEEAVEELRRLAHDAVDLGKVETFFDDQFMEREDFLAALVPTSSPALVSLLQGLVLKMTGASSLPAQEPHISSLPGTDFVHGIFAFSDGSFGLLHYFESDRHAVFTLRGPRVQKTHHFRFKLPAEAKEAFDPASTTLASMTLRHGPRSVN